jgi:hypothetical protein
MSQYAEIDPQITRWVEKNSFKLFDRWADRDIRSVYVSSEAGECFNISIGAPLNGEVSLLVWYVEGPKDPGPEQEWKVKTADIENALDEAFQTVLGWMKPSRRYFPTPPS